MKTESRFLSYVQMLDSALPIGGFSHSFGLETYVQENKISSLSELERYVNDQIHNNWVRMDGLAMKGMYEAIDDCDYRKLCLIDQIFHVQRSSRESREGLHKIGKRLLKLGKTLYPWMKFNELESALKKYAAFGSLPAIHTWIAYHLDVSCDEAVKGYLYTSTVTAVNSALRLMSIGQTEGQLFIHRSLQTIDEEWEALMKQNQNSAHTFAIAQEIQAMKHETLYSRLFMS